jgi:hypothetical protein
LRYVLSCAAVPLFSSGSLPPACAQCINTLQLAKPGLMPQESPWSMLRSASGQTRLDVGNTSIITDPRTQVRMVLDHLNQTFRVMPLTPPGMPAMPGMPQAAMAGIPGVGLPAMPAVPSVSFQDLGKKIMDGLEVQGKRYIIPSGSMETWNSTKLHMPVLTSFSGPFGQQTCKCAITPAEPNPSMFQIPPGYKQIPTQR